MFGCWIAESALLMINQVVFSTRAGHPWQWAIDCPASSPPTWSMSSRGARSLPHFQMVEKKFSSKGWEWNSPQKVEYKILLKKLRKILLQRLRKEFSSKGWEKNPLQRWSSMGSTWSCLSRGVSITGKKKHAQIFNCTQGKAFTFEYKLPTRKI